MFKLIIVLFSIIIFLFSCQKDKKPTTRLGVVIPTSESKMVKLFSYSEDGKTKTIITSKGNVIFRNSKEIWLDQIRLVHIIEEDGKDKYIQLTANKGKVNYKTLNCEAWDNAVIIRDKEVRIESERIFWNQTDKKFYTKDEEEVVIFKIIHPNNSNDQSMIKTVGRNLVADNALKTIELDEGVTIVPRSSIRE